VILVFFAIFSVVAAAKAILSEEAKPTPKLPSVIVLLMSIG
jgi:hypothetical protein